jgi:hypothetical protein
MGQSEFNLSFSEDTTRSSNLCASCGGTAEIHLTLLGETPQRSGSFCLPCGEALMHDLQQKYAIHGHVSLASMDTAHPSFVQSTPLHDDVEGGIVFWEGHGWSSDGPFAGA